MFNSVFIKPISLPAMRLLVTWQTFSLARQEQKAPGNSAVPTLTAAAEARFVCMEFAGTRVATSLAGVVLALQVAMKRSDVCTPTYEIPTSHFSMGAPVSSTGA